MSNALPLVAAPSLAPPRFTIFGQVVPAMPFPMFSHLASSRLYPYSSSACWTSVIAPESSICFFLASASAIFWSALILMISSCFASVCFAISATSSSLEALISICSFSSFSTATFCSAAISASFLTRSASVCSLASNAFALPSFSAASFS